MKYSKELRLEMLKVRYTILKMRGEVMNAGILAKINREIRRLENA